MNLSGVKSMQNILNRELINKDINFISFTIGKPKTYEQLCKRINQAKNLMISKGVSKGDLVTILNLSQSFDTTAILFAIFELGCVTTITSDYLWEDIETNFIDTTNYNILGIKKEWRWSDMNTPAWGEEKKGNLYGDAGFRWHNAKGFCNLPLEIIEYSELDDVSDEDVGLHFVDVDETDICYMSEKFGWHRYHTHKEVLSLSRDCIDIFGFRDKKVGMTKSQHHLQAFELCNLPALMTARKVFELPISDIIPSNEIEEYAMGLSCKLIQRNNIELVWGVHSHILEWIHKNFEFSDTVFVRPEGQIYGDMKSRPKCV